MLYYQDLSIWGEDRKRHLDPGNDIIYKGLDFFNCLHYLSVKINDAFNPNNPNSKYTLLVYDILTLCNLVESRLTPPHGIEYNIYDDRISTKNDSYFYWPEGYKKSKLSLEYLDKTLAKVVRSDLAVDNWSKYIGYIKFVQKMIKTRKNKIEKSLSQKLTKQPDVDS